MDRHIRLAGETERVFGRVRAQSLQGFASADSMWP